MEFIDIVFVLLFIYIFYVIRKNNKLIGSDIKYLIDRLDELQKTIKDKK